MNDKKRIREFLRLLSRSENLDDPVLIKSNIAELNRQYTDLFEDNLIPPHKEIEYMGKIRQIQDKLNPKVAPSKVKARIEPNHKENDEESISQERERHQQILTKMLVETSKLNEKAGQISIKQTIDEEILKETSNNLESLNNAAKKTTDHLNVTKSERLGWRTYFEFLFFIGVYIVITIFF